MPQNADFGAGGVVAAQRCQNWRRRPSVSAEKAGKENPPMGLAHITVLHYVQN
jgi:hypothetical protein